MPYIKTCPHGICPKKDCEICRKREHRERARKFRRLHPYYSTKLNKRLRETSPTYRKNQLESQRRWRKNLKIQLLEKIGNKCIICNSTKRLVFHEVNGKSHPLEKKPKFDYIMEHPEDFVTLCRGHHLALHFLASTNPIENMHGFFKLLIMLRNNKR